MQSLSTYLWDSDWILPLNKPSDSWLILTQQSMGGNEYGKSGHLSIFTSLKHFLMLLKCNSGLHLSNTLSKTLITFRDMQLRFFKVEILLRPFNPLSTRPHQDVVWYNNSWLDFLKILNYVPKEREKYTAKNAMAHRNYFRQNILQILKLATYAKLEDHYFRCKLTDF